MPAEAKGRSEASAKAFVRFWVDTLNYAGSSGDTAELKRISHADCTSCEGVIGSIDRVYADGGHYMGRGWSVETIKYQPLQPRKKPVLTVGVDIAPQKVLEKRGGKTTTFDGGNRSMTFRLGAAEGEWILLQLDQPQ